MQFGILNKRQQRNLGIDLSTIEGDVMSAANTVTQDAATGATVVQDATSAINAVTGQGGGTAPVHQDPASTPAPASSFSLGKMLVPGLGLGALLLWWKRR